MYERLISKAVFRMSSYSEPYISESQGIYDTGAFVSKKQYSFCAILTQNLPTRVL